MKKLIIIFFALLLPSQVLAQDYKVYIQYKELVSQFLDYIYFLKDEDMPAEKRNSCKEAILSLFVAKGNPYILNGNVHRTCVSVLRVAPNGLISQRVYSVKDYFSRLQHISGERMRVDVRFGMGDFFMFEFPESIVRKDDGYEHRVVCIPGDYLYRIERRELIVDLDELMRPRTVILHDTPLPPSCAFGDIKVVEVPQDSYGAYNTESVKKAIDDYLRSPIIGYTETDPRKKQEHKAKWIQEKVDDLVSDFRICVKRKSKPGLTPESRTKNIIEGCSLFLGKGDSCVVDNEIFVATVYVDGKPQNVKDFFADSTSFACYNIDSVDVYELKPDDVEKQGEGLFLCNYRMLADTSKRKLMYSATNPAKDGPYVALDNVKLSIFNNDTTDSCDPVFFIVEDMPEYPGGESAMRKYIQNSLQYPEEARLKKISGTVYVHFIISENGRVYDAEVSRGVHPLLDNEAVRIIESMPRWKPGSQRGRRVQCRSTVPVVFSLK